MKTHLLFIFTALMAIIGEGISAPPSLATMTGIALLGQVHHPADAASWGEVQAQRYLEVSSPRDSSQCDPIHSILQSENALFQTCPTQY